MANKKLAAALSAAISLTIISAGCGRNENLRVNPAVTADIKNTTDKQTTTQTQITTTDKMSAAVSTQTDVSKSITPPDAVTQQELSDEYDNKQQGTVTKAQIEAQGPGPGQAPSQPGPQPDTNNDNQQEEDEPTYINGILIANKTYGLPQSYAPGGLTSATNDAFTQLKSAAAEQGLNIWNQSGFRSYETQQRLYNNYVLRDGKEEADTYSARPGHSEHQTGLAIDLNTIDDSFENTAEYRWVSENCHKYGFIIRYPKGKESFTGYQYEPWHIRYLGVETATAVYNSGLSLEEYLGITSQYAD